MPPLLYDDVSKMFYFIAMNDHHVILVEVTEELISF